MSTFRKVIGVNDSPAIIIPGAETVTLTYRDLSSLIAQFQQLFYAEPLRSIAPLQSAIAISLPNSLEFAVSFLATTTAGRIAAPLNSNYKKEEFDFYLEDLKAPAVVVKKGTHLDTGLEICKSAKANKAKLIEIWWDHSLRRLEFEVYHEKFLTVEYTSIGKPTLQNHAVELPGNCSPGDVAMILHTSGTTGRPKAVPLTHLNIVTSMKNITHTYDLSPSDRTYLVMPLFHVHGLIGAFLSTLYSGGSVIIPPKFSAHLFWDDFIEYRANWYSAVPTIHMILLNTKVPEHLPKIRFIRSCSSALAPPTFHKLEATFKAPVLEAYAMTEAAHQMTSNNLPGKGLERSPGTIGVGQGVEVIILDDDGYAVPEGVVGEVSICGSNVTSGYINNEKANREAFTFVHSKGKQFFRTGDQGKIERGYVILTGRIKELINRGGEKISPIELDGVMLGHPDVDEAVAFGVDDAKYGQVVHAAIVLKPGSKLTDKQLHEYLSTKLSSFKVPQRFYFVSKLPKTATGKIQRRKMVDAFVKPKL
ncbi:unnamed protein product [Kuraishia capsulata CBS 1993]|uniref:Peroxisomal-coenzyme A synthetase n=1 Tax=Kuraishia capsulata CBS 1993 TaxID=1382522 RepID=W6MJ09_9ASCO|nr:uncharacterized protein KUCA_T00001904001 [Kuraishia capsulata CBS 1993]CDK25933.1 unnamed protein product [Kuraishia capsulata CBS 1993]